MKKLYWRPSKVSWQIYLLIAILSLGGMAAVEMFKVKVKQPHYQEKLKAAHIMQDGMQVLRDYRAANLAQSAPIDAEVDPAGTGLVGLLISPITSNTGSLDAKRTTLNPNWAAVVVDMLREADVKPGDTVAVSLSGSFPGLALAVFSAAEALDLKVIALCSLASSTWGANIPDFTWLDMEQMLNRYRVISFRSVASSLGGKNDRAAGMSKEGRDMLKQAIERSGVRFINVKDAKENLDARMALYQEFADGKPIAAFVNVGGGSVSVGTAIGKRLFEPGLTRRPDLKALEIDSLLSRFARNGVPVIHLRLISELAPRYGLPAVPDRVPAVGEGGIFMKMEYRTWLVVTVLALIVAALYVFIKMDVGYRIFSPTRKSRKTKPPEPMV